MDNKTGRKTKEAVNSAHFLAVTLCEIVVYRNYVNALSCKRVKISGKGSNKSLTLTCLHLGNSSLMKQYTAEQLNAEGSLTENSVRRLSDESECLWQYIVKSFTVGKIGFKLVGISFFICFSL